MSTNKKKVQLTHLAVVQDGTLRLVRVDGDDGLVELAAMSVGAGIKLADTVSAAVALAEIVGSIGGGSRPTPPTPVPDEKPLAKLRSGKTDVATNAATGSVLSKEPPVKAGKAKKAEGDVIDRLHAAAKSKRRKRTKRPNERRFTDADLYDELDRARHNGNGGLKGSEMARIIANREGVDYHHKDPLVRAVTNRMSNMWRAGLLVRNDSGVYSIPVPEMTEAMATALAVEEAGDKPVRSVDDLPVVAEDGGNFPPEFRRVSSAERLDRVAANGRAG